MGKLHGLWKSALAVLSQPIEFEWHEYDKNHWDSLCNTEARDGLEKSPRLVRETLLLLLASRKHCESRARGVKSFLSAVLESSGGLSRVTLRDITLQFFRELCELYQSEAPRGTQGMTENNEPKSQLEFFYTTPQLVQQLVLRVYCFDRQREQDLDRWWKFAGYIGAATNLEVLCIDCFGTSRKDDYNPRLLALEGDDEDDDIWRRLYEDRQSAVFEIVHDQIIWH